LEYLTLFCNENLLLTIHDSPVARLQQPEFLEGANEWLPERSIAGLVSAMLIDQSIVCLQHVSDVRKSILILEERMDRVPDTVSAEEIMDVRSELETLEMVVSDQLPAVEALSATDRPFYRLKEGREYMSCTLTNMQAADRSLDRLAGRINALRFAFQMHAQEKTNRRLGVLTILSAIFMPITLLAGIWGMNFQNMPELGYPFAYPMALGLMVMIGLGMYFFFRRAGWFD